MKIEVQLRNQAGAVSFDEMALQVSYFLKGEGGEFIPKTVMHLPPASGDVTQTFEDALALERQVFFALVLRSTNILAQAAYVARLLREETPVVLTFDYVPVTLRDPEPEAAPPKPLFAYGRLLEKNGRKKMEDVQIIFEATRSGETSSQAIATVRTEANGYFFIEYPEGPFVRAAARVGLAVVHNPVQVKLEPGSQPEELIFPRNIIVVVELAESEEPADDGECGCKELDVHEPKRVLEEYSFYSLVRTTEPEILGYVLEDEDDITLSDILNDHPIRVGEIIDPIIKLPVFANVRAAPRFIRTAPSAPTVPEGEDEFSEAIKKIKINRGVLGSFLKRETAITKDNVVRLIDLNEALRFRKKITPAGKQPLGRVMLSATNTVDWDLEPTLYQSVSVAHGHLLHFKSEWIADGYSLGDLLYSLPLAPGQKKQIVVFDWERRESAANLQSVEYEESLYNSLSRDRDIFEITKGTIQENISGKSSATTASASVGAGGVLGGVLFGVSGGVGHSGSSASQTSLRQTSASDLQKIRDRIVQSANAVRSQRSSVIQTVSQGERFEVSSETVANYNHCHAITIQYFEVLRHFKVRQRLADARECLFVPLLMSQFDLDKSLRWKEALQAALINGKLAKAFEAAERVKNEWADSNFPSGTFASERILHATGNFQIRFVIRRPDDKLVEVDDTSKPIVGPQGIVGYQKKTVEEINEANWQTLIPFLGADTPKGFYDHHLKSARNKDEVFHRLLGEKIATSFVNSLTFHVADETGNEISSMNFDASLSSRYRKEGVLNVSLRFMGPSQFSRDKLHYIKIRCGSANILPEHSSITLESGFIRYRTPHYEGFLCRYQSIQDDLSPSDGVTLFAGPGNDELRDPRKDDIAAVNKLIDHLNDNLEFYHKAIWMRMSPERRFMLLDGIILPGSKGLGRSLASLVENDLIGIVGNSLVFPVAQGLNLDPNFGLSDSLTDYYMVSATDPISICVPTKGVFAEAMIGRCNSCEQKDESRFWRWEESPIPDSPTAINPISTESRRAEPGNLQPAALPTPVLNIQNAVGLPDPTGLGGTLSLLGKGDSFRDITGLAANQQNAIDALKASFETTKAFGQEAAKLETQKAMDRRLDTALNKIKNSGLPADKQAELTEKALNAFVGAGAKQEAAQRTDQQKADGVKTQLAAIKEAVDSGVISAAAGEHLANTSLQHSLFGSAAQVTPGTIEAQDLLSNPTLANKDLEFENSAFKISAKAPAGQVGAGATALASVIAPFPTSKLIVPRDMANAGLMTCAGAVASDPDVSPMCGAVDDLTGNPALPPYFGFNDTEMLYVASVAKLYPMYAAFELRRRVEKHAKFMIAGGLSTSTAGWEQRVFAELETAWQPKLNAAFRNLPRGFPKLGEILVLSATGDVKFAEQSPPLTDAELDAIGEHGEPQGKFRDWMRLMLRWSNDKASSKCIQALSYPYINGVLAGAGFFDKDTRNGLWISGDYRNGDWLVANQAGQPLSPRWAQLQARRLTNFSGTALQLTRFMTLIAQRQLVDRNSSDEMIRIMTGAAGIGSYVQTGLGTATPPRAFTSVTSKIGFGDDNFSHDCAIVRVDRGGDPARTLHYVVVALGSHPPKNRADLRELAVGFHDCIVAAHP